MVGHLYRANYPCAGWEMLMTLHIRPSPFLDWPVYVRVVRIVVSSTDSTNCDVLFRAACTAIPAMLATGFVLVFGLPAQELLQDGFTA